VRRVWGLGAFWDEGSVREHHENIQAQMIWARLLLSLSSIHEYDCFFDIDDVLCLLVT
jgi:hypothetical protein